MTKLVYRQSTISTTYPHHPPLTTKHITHHPPTLPRHQSSIVEAAALSKFNTCTPQNWWLDLQSLQHPVWWIYNFMFHQLFLHMMILLFCQKQHLCDVFLYSPENSDVTLKIKGWKMYSPYWNVRPFFRGRIVPFVVDAPPATRWWVAPNPRLCRPGGREVPSPTWNQATYTVVMKKNNPNNATF